MCELQAESGHLIREAKLIRFRKNVANVRRTGTGLDTGDGVVEPLASFFVRVVLRGRRAHNIEGPVVAGAIAHEALQNVEESLVARTDHAVCESMRMRVAALAGNGVDRFDVVGAVRIEELVDL